MFIYWVLTHLTMKLWLNHYIQHQIRSVHSFPFECYLICGEIRCVFLHSNLLYLVTVHMHFPEIDIFLLYSSVSVFFPHSNVISCTWCFFFCLWSLAILLTDWTVNTDLWPQPGVRVSNHHQLNFLLRSCQNVSQNPVISSITSYTTKSKKEKKNLKTSNKTFCLFVCLICVDFSNSLVTQYLNCIMS